MSRVASGRGCRYRGVRRRRWGKWVSEIRVPGTRERLWLGSYAAPEAAAVAHDAAACLLRGHAGGGHLNFPERAACYVAHHHHRGQGHQGQPPLSPRSVQRVASDAGMAADAQLLEARERASPPPTGQQVARVGIGVARDGDGSRGQWPYARPACSDRTSAAATSWCTASRAEESRSSNAGTSEHEHRLVYGDISVDDMEILMQ